VKIPIISITEETLKDVQKKKIRAISILATSFTISNRIYHNQLSKNNIKIIKLTENQQRQIDEIIIKIESGKSLKVHKDTLIKIMMDLRDAGAEAMILGCTEIPLLIQQKDVSIPLFDSGKILAESAFNLLIKKDSATDP